MPQAERSIVIKRPLSDVFAFFADPENDRQWRAGVKEISRQSGAGVGAVYRQRLSGPMGRSIPADIEITEYEPDSRIGFRAIAGPVRPQGSYRFRAVPGEQTDVTVNLSAELAGLKKLVMGRSVQRAMDGEMANLDRAKQLLESHS
jgi:uncharacterized membrane protein